MSELIELSFSFKGGSADSAMIEMYDGARAIAGFHRSLAITTHLILNGEIITQAPSLKGAYIYMPAPEAGSWKTRAKIALGGLGALGIAAGTASTDSNFGHLVASGYAYVTKEALGFEADYEGTLQEQIREHNERTGSKLDVSRFDGVVEKVEQSITDMHRPIVKSGSAETGTVQNESPDGNEYEFPVFNRSTYDYIIETYESKAPQTSLAKISSYNVNTHSGRAYIDEIGNRTIQFKLSPQCQKVLSVSAITKSLSLTAGSTGDLSHVYLTFLTNQSSTGRIKSIYVIDVMTVKEYELRSKILNL